MRLSKREAEIEIVARGIKMYGWLYGVVRMAGKERESSLVTQRHPPDRRGTRSRGVPKLEQSQFTLVPRIAP